MTVPYTFATATSSIPLSQLDSNFNTGITIGNTSVTLGNTVTTLNNMTLANVTISSVATSINNLTLTNVTISSGTINANATAATVDSVNVVGYMGIPQNSQSGNYNIVIGDAGKHIYHPSGQAAATYTLPANSNVAFTTGTAITIVNGSANNVSIAITTDTMTLANSATTGTRTLTANGVATCVKVTSTSWIISGVGLS